MVLENTALNSSAAGNAFPLSARSKVLIVDGSAERRRELALILHGLALEILEAADALEAMALVTTDGLNLVIVDFHLEGFSAVKLCQTLKQARPTQLLPVFVMAQNGDAGHEVQAIEAGADAFFAAPPHPQVLRARVRASLRYKAALDSLDDSQAALLSLAQSVEGRDSGLGQHCQRLALIVSTVGRALPLPERDIVTLQRAAYLHDIGKVSVPDSILFKAGPLTPDEWEIMKSHAEKGERICGGIRSLAQVLPVIRHHHEKWNGSGYPDGLQGEEIPLLARILQLADIYDALTTPRCYKAAFTSEEAVQIMREEVRKGWRDPQLTERFIELIPVFSAGPLPDNSSLSLQALGRSLQQVSENAEKQQLQIPGLYNGRLT